MLVVFSPVFVADTKIIFRYDFVAPLTFYILMFKTNEPIKIAHLPKLANQSLLNGALVMEMVNNTFSESKKNFGRLIKQKKF